MFIDPNRTTNRFTAPMIASYRKGRVQYVPSYANADERAAFTVAARKAGLEVVYL